MSDPLLEANMILVFNYPLQSLCFIGGGIFVFFGLAITAIIPSERWRALGMSIVFSGALIAFPGVMPIMMTLVGGETSNVSILPTWVLPIAYLIFPTFGVGFGAYGWYEFAKPKTSKH